MQVRFPVILTAEEKEIARKIVLAFGQVRYGRERGDVDAPALKRPPALERSIFVSLLSNAQPTLIKCGLVKIADKSSFACTV